MPINALIALIAAAVPAINSLVGFVNRTIETLKQSKEMTPEKWAEVRASIADIDAAIEPDFLKTDAEKAEGSRD